MSKDQRAWHEEHFPEDVPLPTRKGSRSRSLTREKEEIFAELIERGNTIAEAQRILRDNYQFGLGGDLVKLTLEGLNSDERPRGDKWKSRRERLSPDQKPRKKK